MGMVVMVVVVVVVAVVVVDDVVKAEEDWIRNGSATVAMITSMLSMFQIGGGGGVIYMPDMPDFGTAVSDLMQQGQRCWYESGTWKPCKVVRARGGGSWACLAHGLQCLCDGRAC